MTNIQNGRRTKRKLERRAQLTVRRKRRLKTTNRYWSASTKPCGANAGAVVLLIICKLIANRRASHGICGLTDR